MNVKNFPEVVWDKLATEAIRAYGQNPDLNSLATDVDDYFYFHIYSTWSLGKVDYSPNLPSDLDVGWDEIVDVWNDAAKETTLKATTKDQSLGTAFFQMNRDRVTGGPDRKGARVGERYGDYGNPVSRFQFVVHSGGGQVLFNRMRKACQEYIRKNQRFKKQRSAIQQWKVFGEEQGSGRSDSCVVYLSKSYKNPSVVHAVNSYIWPAVRDLVEPSFEPLGFFRVGGKQLWALDLPSDDQERKVLGAISEGSAGGLMGLILGRGFLNAVDTLSRDSKKIRKPALIDEAKSEVDGLIADLYGGSLSAPAAKKASIRRKRVVAYRRVARRR